MKLKSLLLLGCLSLTALSSCGSSTDIETSITDEKLLTMVKKPPKNGSPLDYSITDNIAFAAYKLKSNPYFESIEIGEVQAKVAFIPYNQSIKNKLLKNNNTYVMESLSSSAFVKVGEQKYFKNGQILVRDASKVKLDAPEWKENVFSLKKDYYDETYGIAPDNFSNYILNSFSIINSSLKSSNDKEYTYSLSLDPLIAAHFYQRKIKTYANSSTYPTFNDISLEVTIDSSWQVSSIKSIEHYKVAILGGISTSSELVTTFNYGQNSIQEYATIFDTHLDNAADYVPPLSLDEQELLDNISLVSSSFLNLFENNELKLKMNFKVATKVLNQADELPFLDLDIYLTLSKETNKDSSLDPLDKFAVDVKIVLNKNEERPALFIKFHQKDGKPEFLLKIRNDDAYGDLLLDEHALKLFGFSNIDSLDFDYLSLVHLFNLDKVVSNNETTIELNGVPELLETLESSNKSLVSYLNNPLLLSLIKDKELNTLLSQVKLLLNNSDVTSFQGFVKMDCSNIAKHSLKEATFQLFGKLTEATEKKSYQSTITISPLK